MEGKEHHEIRQRVLNDEMQQHINILMHLEFATDTTDS